MALSEARKRANKKWNDENQKKIYDRVQLVFKKGTKDTIKAHAEEQGESLNGYIKKAVADRYKGDTGNDIEL
ncbi:Uncharacterised protein [uncultured Ruminococcus sp.]|uniref:hypothetical protein n=1 Tax=Massiliimalia timonensis TaxID=1987501 RepID=UPI0008206456|nr:hypothetical protein [Massiliimalia timonensis]SCG97229.1 Uncharacterised protein [uncultured Clostridium sp.]SCH93308.1 Uncharacterised protein [uncultured Ruminococcus sp.]